MMAASVGTLKRKRDGWDDESGESSDPASLYYYDGSPRTANSLATCPCVKAAGVERRNQKMRHISPRQQQSTSVSPPLSPSSRSLTSSSIWHATQHQNEVAKKRDERIVVSELSSLSLKQQEILAATPLQSSPVVRARWDSVYPIPVSNECATTAETATTSHKHTMSEDEAAIAEAVLRKRQRSRYISELGPMIEESTHESSDDDWRDQWRGGIQVEMMPNNTQALLPRRWRQGQQPPDQRDEDVEFAEADCLPIEEITLDDKSITMTPTSGALVRRQDNTPYRALFDSARDSHGQYTNSYDYINPYTSKPFSSYFKVVYPPSKQVTSNELISCLDPMARLPRWLTWESAKDLNDNVPTASIEELPDDWVNEEGVAEVYAQDADVEEMGVTPDEYDPNAMDID